MFQLKQNNEKKHQIKISRIFQTGAEYSFVTFAVSNISTIFRHKAAAAMMFLTKIWVNCLLFL